MGAQYVKDNSNSEDRRERYYNLIVKKLDVYNYKMKYKIFGNDKFFINILNIIDDNELSKILKSKIKDRPDIVKEERYGRRVLF